MSIKYFYLIIFTVPSDIQHNNKQEEPFMLIINRIVLQVDFSKFKWEGEVYCATWTVINDRPEMMLFA